MEDYATVVPPTTFELLSHSESLTTFFINLPFAKNITHPGSLEEFAHRAFALAEQYPDGTPAPAPGLMVQQFALVLYPTVQNGDAGFSPVQAIFQQNRLLRLAHLTVDFQTRTAVYMQATPLAIEPNEIARVHDLIESHMRNSWQRNREGKKASLLHEHGEWKAFFQHLASGGVLSAEADLNFYASLIHKQCPLCETRTSRCASCLCIVCLNSACAASQVVPFQACSQHVDLVHCLPCLESKRPLAQCPRCALWFCTFELMWCLGRPKDLASRSPEMDPHGIPDSGREHPAKPVACLVCAGNEEAPRCANSRCWSVSDSDGITCICEACLREGGLWCACGQRWMCDGCNSSPLDRCFTDCLRCGRTFCPDVCNSVGTCGWCGLSTLCDDCFEEDWGAVGAAVVIKGKCDAVYCGKRLCGRCLERARCVGCGNTFCASCHLRRMGDLGGGHSCPLKGAVNRE